MLPFKYGQVVRGKDFCGRDALLKPIREFINAGQNIVVLGERRVGKTSLVLEAARREKVKVLYVDLLLVMNISDLCQRILQGIFEMEQNDAWHVKIVKMLGHLRPAVTFDQVTMMPSVHFEAAADMKADSIQQVLALVKNAVEGKRAVVILDEFQGILNLPDSREALALMRRSIQFHSKIPYIFAGSIRHRMDGIFTDPDSAFFKSAIPITVEPLSYKEFAPFLTKRFEEGKRKLADEVLRRAYDITYGITGDVQQICEALWEMSNERDLIDEKTLGKALLLIFSREQKSYERELARLTNLQVRCLAVMARNGVKASQTSSFMKAVGHMNASAVRKAVQRLVATSLLYEVDGEYRFFNPFFRHWLLQKGIS